MTPHDSGPRRRNWRRTLKGVPRGRHVTHQVEATYGRGQQDRDRRADFSAFCAARREMTAATAGEERPS